MAGWSGMQPRPRTKVTSSGGVVYRWENGKPLFLLLASNKRGVWCLPKGLIEQDEDEVTAAMREVREETGVSRVKLRGKVGLIRYQFGFRAKTFDKTVHFYLFETDQADAKVGTEHDSMEWLHTRPEISLVQVKQLKSHNPQPRARVVSLILQKTPIDEF